MQAEKPKELKHTPVNEQCFCLSSQIYMSCPSVPKNMLSRKTVHSLRCNNASEEECGHSTIYNTITVERMLPVTVIVSFLGRPREVH